MQPRLFQCWCGDDQLTHPHEHPIPKYQCPICHEIKLFTEDPVDATHVCAGEAVCSSHCMREGYRRIRVLSHKIRLVEPTWFTKAIG